jgi:ribosomal protection tetracycline resistance protein
VPMGRARDAGTNGVSFVPYGEDDATFTANLVDVLARTDDALLAAYVNAGGVAYRRLRKELAAQTQHALVHPVFAGAALTGAGVETVMAGISRLLPSAVGAADGPVSGSVFKIVRGPAGEKVAYVRMFSGTVRTRDRLPFGRGLDDKVNAIGVFERGSIARRTSVSAGEIAKVWGLSEIQIGDRIGEAGPGGTHHQFAPPTLETVVVPRSSDDRARLHVALAQLAEQDPLINVRQNADSQEISVSLYGEVQKEVIQATLANDFGLDVTFRETRTIYVERPIGTGEAVEFLQEETNPFSATIGFRVDSAPTGLGVQFRLDVDPRHVPVYIYKSADNFVEAMTEHTGRTLQEGLFGWQVTDCVVTMNACGYYIGDGPGKPSGTTPRTTAADFRKLTPMVLMRALKRARTRVCEPIMRASIETPTDNVSVVLAALARLGGAVETPSVQPDLSVIAALLPAASAQDLTRELPSLTGGEGVVETSFGGYRPVRGASPTRRRTMANPLNRVEYIMQLRGRAFRAANQREESGN